MFEKIEVTKAIDLLESIAHYKDETGPKFVSSYDNKALHINLLNTLDAYMVYDYINNIKMIGITDVKNQELYQQSLEIVQLTKQLEEKNLHIRNLKIKKAIRKILIFLKNKN